MGKAAAMPPTYITKEKLGNYLIDISKYTLTAVFIASLFKDLEEMKWIESLHFHQLTYNRFITYK